MASLHPKGGVWESGHRCRGLQEVCYCALICLWLGVERGFNIYIDRQSKAKNGGSRCRTGNVGVEEGKGVKRTGLGQRLYCRRGRCVYRSGRGEF